MLQIVTFRVLLLLALAALVRHVSAGEPTQTEPLARTCTDALYTIPEVAGRVIRVRDLDGDGREDLALLLVKGSYGPQRIAFASSRDGRELRTLVELQSRALAYREMLGDDGGGWDAGADFDGDGVPDVVLVRAGIVDPVTRVPRVQVLSGVAGAELLAVSDPLASTAFGREVVVLGDVDADGTPDFVTSAPRTAEDGVTGSLSAWSGRGGKLLWRIEDESGSRDFASWIRRVPDVDGYGRDDVVLDVRRRSREVALEQRMHGEQASVFDGARVVSSKSGERIAIWESNGGPITPVGDLDHDGVADFAREETNDRGEVTLVSGKSQRQLFALRYPDVFDPYACTFALGDLDGDGWDDFALGSPNFGLPETWQDGEAKGKPIDLRTAPLRRVLTQGSDPHIAFTPEAGSALVYSGKTRAIVAGVFGAPGKNLVGVGLEIAALPDVNGDGALDFAVVDGHGLHAFAGPGPVKK